jgi:exonuclease VII small subunit
MLQQADLEDAIDTYEETTKLAIEAAKSITLALPVVI